MTNLPQVTALCSGSEGLSSRPLALETGLLTSILECLDRDSLGKPHLLVFQLLFKNLSEANAKGTAWGSHWVGGVHGHRVASSPSTLRASF